MANLFFTEDFLFDSHCHLNDSKFDEDREGCIRRAVDAGVQAIIDVGVNVETSESAIQSAVRFPGNVMAAVGIDPDVLTPGSELFDAEINIDRQMQIIRRLISQNPNVVVALGETGMDNYHISTALEKGELTLGQYNQIREQQELLFTLHLGLAEETGMPLTIHSRGAEQRCLEIISSFPNARGVFHSFTGEYELAKQILDSGWGLGLNGIVTFKNAEGMRALYKRILGEITPDWTPADLYKRGVYIETDAPYLAPEGKRGERNEPSYVADIWSYILGNPDLF